MESHGHSIAKTISKNKVERLVFPDYKTFYKVTTMKIVWYWHKHRKIQ